MCCYTSIAKVEDFTYTVILALVMKRPPFMARHTIYFASKRSLLLAEAHPRIVFERPAFLWKTI